MNNYNNYNNFNNNNNYNDEYYKSRIRENQISIDEMQKQMAKIEEKKAMLERKQYRNNNVYSILFIFVILFFAFLTAKSLYVKQTYDITNAKIIEISDIRTERKPFVKSNRNNKNVYMDITLQTINDETIFLDDEKIDFGKKSISKGQNMELYYKGNDYELGENLNSRIMVNGTLTIIFTIITIASFGTSINNKKNN